MFLNIVLIVRYCQGLPLYYKINEFTKKKAPYLTDFLIALISGIVLSFFFFAFFGLDSLLESFSFFVGGVGVAKSSENKRHISEAGTLHFIIPHLKIVSRDWLT